MNKMISAVLASALPLMASTYAYIAPAYADGNYSNAKIAYGMGNATDSMNRPTDAVNCEAKYSKLGGLFIGDAEHKRLWLTFDEGYENGYTAKILDILKEKNVRAVFFVTLDYAERNPELIRRMIDEGHTVGNHTCTHPSLPECSAEKQREELSRLHEYIRQNFSYDMYVMRPPKGEFSEQVLISAKELGYTTVLWSFAYPDWDVSHQPDAAFAYNKITSKTHNGAVYLLHAVSETNTKILGKVIDYWHDNGYIITPM